DNKRRSGSLTLQYRPVENFEIRLDSLHSDLKQHYNMYQGNNFYPGAGALGPSPTDEATANSDGVWESWSGSNVFAWVQGNRYHFDQKVNSTALSAKLNLQGWDISAEVSSGKATEYTTQTYISWATRAPGADLYYNSTDDPDGPLSFGFYNGFDANDPSHYYFFGVQGSYREPTEDRIKNAKFDVVRHFEDAGYLKAVRFGVNYSDRILATTPNYMTNSAAGLPSDMSPYLTVHNNSHYFKTYDGGATIPRNYLTVNLDKFFDDFSLEEIVAVNPPVQSLTTTTKVQEKSKAAYVRFDFASPSDLLRANVGLRIVRTDGYSSGYVPTLDAYLVYGQFGGANSLSYSNATGRAQESRYTNALPSLNVRYQLGNDILLRFAAARVMQRPDMNLLAAASSPNASGGIPPTGVEWRGTLAMGNPDLKPFISDQFDVSLEWYFSGHNMLGLALFTKDVQNLVLTNYRSEVADVTMYGSGEVRQITLAVSQPINSESSRISGIELAYQQQFNFLPGLWRHVGLRGNVTYLDYGSVVLNQGEPALPLTGISKHTYNLGAYYDDGTFSLQAGYNYRSRWVENPLGNFGDGIFTEGYGQLDVAANYKVNERLSFNAWLVNIEQSALRQTNRYGMTRLYALDGRRFSLGMRLSF
ncbi:MAG: TonB-dependent receptor, partial [Asticcacaulis sp.]